MFGDKVHIGSAIYSNDNRTLTVSAQSGDATATLSLDGFDNVEPTVANARVPRLDHSRSGRSAGRRDRDVEQGRGRHRGRRHHRRRGRLGGRRGRHPGDLNEVQIGQSVTLDGLASTGTIIAPASPGPSPRPAPRVTPVAADGSVGDVQGHRRGHLRGDAHRHRQEQHQHRHVHDRGAQRQRGAGGERRARPARNVVPTSTVTLDGTASKFASSFSWTQDAGDQVQLGTEPEEPDDGQPDLRGPGRPPSRWRSTSR